MLSAKWQPFCIALNVLTHWHWDKIAATLQMIISKAAWILIKVSLKFVPKDLLENKLVLVQVMAWGRPGGKPLSEPMMA